MECSDMSRLTHADLFSFPLGLCVPVTSLRGLELVWKEDYIYCWCKTRKCFIISWWGARGMGVMWGLGDILTGLGVVIKPRQCSVASLGSGSGVIQFWHRCETMLTNIQKMRLKQWVQLKLGCLASKWTLIVSWWFTLKTCVPCVPCKEKALPPQNIVKTM